MQYTNHPPCLPGEKESRELRKLIPRETNVEFKCAAPRSKAGYKKQERLHVATLRNNKAREQLLLNYGLRYSF